MIAEAIVAGAVEGMWMRRVLPVGLVSVLVLSLPLPAVANVGDLDPTFGDGGVVVVPVGAEFEPLAQAEDVVVDDEGRIVAIGRADGDVVVVRLLADGSLDPAFGEGGIAEIDSGAAHVSLKALVITPEGDIVAAASDVLVRLESDGSYSAGFGRGDGIVEMSTEIPSWSVTRDARLQADGSILVAGSAGSPFPEHLALARFSGSGQLDGSFGVDGVATVDIEDSSRSQAQEIVVLDDGRILVAAYSEDAGGAERVVLARFSTSGRPDSTFGESGVALGPSGGVYAMDVQQDGRVVVSGGIPTDDHAVYEGADVFIDRYLSSGVLDTTFSRDGRHRLVADGFQAAVDVSVQPDGSILALLAYGEGYLDEGHAPALLRVDSEGNRDEQWGVDGLARVDIPVDSTWSQIDSFAMQPDSKIVIAGRQESSSGIGAHEMVLYRVLGDGSFTDDNLSEFEADIEWLASEGITRGCNPPLNSRFCPEDPVTRGQMAAFLVRALGYGDRGSVDFVDDDGSVFEADIERLAAAGVTRGCDPPANTRFCPDDAVTRGQMAAFLVRALGYLDRGSVDFVDDDGSEFEADIERLAVAGVTQGCDPPANTRFCPDAPITRGQMAAFLHRALTADAP